MIWRKITTGWVTQVYDDERCIEQEFFAGNPVDVEDMYGEPINYPCEEEYHPFDMVQPDPPDTTL